ncbi:hypothetical protein ACFQOZ_13820 [Comamonas endophytica]|uniref:hypothetical protein n=1 Tax=Comamonas endophytica TaxID=2949090 RepID=UPI00361AF14B
MRQRLVEAFDLLGAQALDPAQVIAHILGIPGRGLVAVLAHKLASFDRALFPMAKPSLWLWPTSIKRNILHLYIK